MLGNYWMRHFQDQINVSEKHDRCSKRANVDIVGIPCLTFGEKGVSLGIAPLSPFPPGPPELAQTCRNPKLLLVHTAPFSEPKE